MALNLETPDGVVILGPEYPGVEKILTKECLAFVAELEREFKRERLGVLQERLRKQFDLDNGALPDFLEETKSIRESEWKVASIPEDLLDRQVEITGPVDRKMIINALNSDAKTFMTDFEDSMSPTWENIIQGQINLMDLWNDEIDFKDPKSGKEYKLNPNPSVLIVRPRGWHLEEAHIEIDGERISGGIFDYAVYLFHGNISSSASASCDFNFDTATSVELPTFVLASSNSSSALDTSLLRTSTFASKFSICSELTAPLDDSATFLRSSAIFSLRAALSPVFVVNSSWSTAVKPKSKLSAITSYLYFFLIFLLHRQLVLLFHYLLSYHHLDFLPLVVQLV